MFFGTDCAAVLFNLIKNSKALSKIVKFLNVLDLAMYIISKIKSKKLKKGKKKVSNESSHTPGQAVQ